MNSPATEVTRRGPNFETLMVVGFMVLLIFAFFYVVSQRQQVLRSSPSGFDGLQIWLTSEEMSAQSFLGGWQVDENAIGMLVVPLFDTNPDVDRDHPRNKEELLLQQDEYDLRIGAVLEKASRVPTLVILPKWRSGMRLTGLAHPVLLSERARIEALLQRVTGQDGAQIGYARTPFSDFDYVTADGSTVSAQIYGAQLIASQDCTPLIGEPNAMLLAECPLAKDQNDMRVLVLSDPDLLNNHGLRLGDNATIARDFLGIRAGERNVMIDYSRDVWLINPKKGERRERSWGDLKRFFGPPFLTLWLGGFLTLGLFIWRSWQRYGPTRGGHGDDSSAKLLAVRARARLMRLSDQDGALVEEYAKARLAATASTLFGPAHARHFSKPRAFLKYVARRSPEDAHKLEKRLEAIRNLPYRITPGEAIHHIDELETLLEQITNDS